MDDKAKREMIDRLIGARERNREEFLQLLHLENKTFAAARERMTGLYDRRVEELGTWRRQALELEEKRVVTAKAAIEETCRSRRQSVIDHKIRFLEYQGRRLCDEFPEAAKYFMGHGWRPSWDSPDLLIEEDVPHAPHRPAERSIAGIVPGPAELVFDGLPPIAGAVTSVAKEVVVFQEANGGDVWEVRTQNLVTGRVEIRCIAGGEAQPEAPPA